MVVSPWPPMLKTSPIEGLRRDDQPRSQHGSRPKQIREAREVNIVISCNSRYPAILARAIEDCFGGLTDCRFVPI